MVGGGELLPVALLLLPDLSFHVLTFEPLRAVPGSFPSNQSWGALLLTSRIVVIEVTVFSKGGTRPTRVVIEKGDATLILRTTRFPLSDTYK